MRPLESAAEGQLAEVRHKQDSLAALSQRLSEIKQRVANVR